MPLDFATLDALRSHHPAWRRKKLAELDAGGLQGRSATCATGKFTRSALYCDATNSG